MISKVHGAFILLLVAIVPAKLAAETFVYSLVGVFGALRQIVKSSRVYLT